MDLRAFHRNSYPTVRRVAAALALLLAVVLAACGNPQRDGSNAGPAPNQPRQPVPVEKVLLQPAYAVDARFRTTRTLRVEELTASERYLTEGIEVTLTRVLSVDERGRLLGVERTWETSSTRFVRGFGNPEERAGELQGCTLELRRRQNGVEATVIAGEVSIRGQAFLMDGFEFALLPANPVAEGERWTLDAPELAGLNRFIEATGFKIEKNSLTCVLSKVTPETAEVALDWQLSGQRGGATAVLQFAGSLVFNRKQKLVSALSLKGGRAGGAGEQIEINLKRRLTDGWFDLDG